MEHQIYGYVRVSTKEQNEDRQLIALRTYSVPEDQIYMDKLSGKDFNRPAYKSLVKRMQTGDVMVIKSIDRLGRNYDEILEQWRYLIKERRIDIVVLDMPLLNTHTNRDLTRTLIADIVLQLLSYVAQTERDNIRQRQAEGIAAARMRGVRFGRPEKQKPPEFPLICRRWESGELSGREAARILQITHSTFFKWAREL